MIGVAAAGATVAILQDSAPKEKADAAVFISVNTPPQQFSEIVSFLKKKGASSIAFVILDWLDARDVAFLKSMRTTLSEEITLRCAGPEDVIRFEELGAATLPVAVKGNEVYQWQ